MITADRKMQFYQKVPLLIFGMGVTTFRASDPELNQALHILHQSHPELLGCLNMCYVLSTYPIHEDFDQAFAWLTHESFWTPPLWWKPVLRDNHNSTSGFMVYWPEAEKTVRRIFQTHPSEAVTFLNLGGELRKLLGFQADLTWIACDGDLHVVWLR